MSALIFRPLSPISISSRALRTSTVASLQQRVAYRQFQTTSRRLDTAAPLPVKKPVGAFRGGIFGFLLGSSLAGAAVYYYILEEYRVSNELLTEDIYALQAAVQRIEIYVRSLEEKVMDKPKKD